MEVESVNKDYFFHKALMVLPTLSNSTAQLILPPFRLGLRKKRA